MTVIGMVCIKLIDSPGGPMGGRHICLVTARPPVCQRGAMGLGS